MGDPTFDRVCLGEGKVMRASALRPVNSRRRCADAPQELDFEVGAHAYAVGGGWRLVEPGSIESASV